MRGSVSPGLFPAIFPRLIAPFLRGTGSFSGGLNLQIAQPRGVPAARFGARLPKIRLNSASFFALRSRLLATEVAE